MIARRGPAWWSRMHERGFRALVLDCDGTLAGYATLGRSRAPALAPARRDLRALPAAGVPGLRPGPAAVRRGAPPAAAARARPACWSGRSAENEIACRFYRAMGGVECARGRGPLLRRAAGEDRLRLGAERGYCSPAGSITPRGQPGETGSAAQHQLATGVAVGADDAREVDASAPGSASGRRRRRSAPAPARRRPARRPRRSRRGARRSRSSPPTCSARSAATGEPLIASTSRSVSS